KLTGALRLKYFRDAPFVKKVVYHNYFKATDSVIVPEAYIVPKGYWNIIALIEANGIEFSEIEKDTIVQAEVYKIASFETVQTPFEGHYLHYGTKVSKTAVPVPVHKGDF